uniref:C-type lectin domain-containing protein n=1 Tax=Amphiprion percula TaxID=161767 RepID=A0A3P8RXA8_AMPPE
VRLKLNSTRRGPTRFGGGSVQGPKVLFIEAGICVVPWLTFRCNKYLQKLSLHQKNPDGNCKCKFLCKFLRWVHFNHSFYYISSVKKNWNESRNDCLQRGADLVIIDSEEKQVLSDRIWIGMKYNESTEWKWVDETLLTQRSFLFVCFSYWLHGEPNGVEKDEHCVEIKRNNDDKGWNDAPCTVTKTWICEKKVAL